MFAAKDAFFSNVNGTYAINNSLRFRSSASAYLNRTFATPTSSTIYTLSLWVKRGTLTTTQNLFGASTTTRLGFNSSDQLVLVLAGTTAITTTAVYRDPSSWYHIIYTQNGSAQTIYVNETSVGTGTTANTVFNTAIAHQLAAANTTNYFDGYLAEVNFVDGQTLTPSSFGVTGPNNVWQPTQYTGSYGTNGFYLKFASFGTAAALGTDSSGNGNTWTVNNVSVTAGTTYDPMLDVPTLTSATVANYAVLSPIDSNLATITNGNLLYTSTAGTVSLVNATVGMLGSKWYAEFTPTGSAQDMIGICDLSAPVTSRGWTTANGYFYWGFNGQKYTNNAGATYGASYGVGNVIGVAVDMSGGGSTGTITFYRDGVSQGAAYSTLDTTKTWAFAYSSATGTAGVSGYANFGQRAFIYSPPSGYAALNAYNIPTGAVTTSGSFTGNALADGPTIWLNGTPTAMTINGNAVTFGTQTDKLASGFKLRTTSTSYNSTGTNTYSVSTTGAQFKYQIAQGNP